MEDSPASRPLLTIAIPTWNRSRFLAESLEALRPQLVGLSQVELCIYDNASPDDTTAVVQRFQSSGMPIDYRRQPTNIGADANFADCFNTARGRYVWVLSDDDIVLPNALPRIVSLLEQDREFALVYVTDFSFYKNALAEATPDPYGRTLHVLRNRKHFASAVNLSFTFISVIIANKETFEAIPHEPIEKAIGSNLIQLSWALPLLAHGNKFLVVYDRVLGARQANTGGYTFSAVFGHHLTTMVRRYLSDQPALADAILHGTLRIWLPTQLYKHIKQHGAAETLSTQELSALRAAYGRDWRFWLFVWPIFHLPQPLIGIWVVCGKQFSNLLTLIHTPQRLRKSVR